uniref:RRM domain-containing protein n=1 Tax=Oryza punctata TaxID=4537 RepID=A0A0E0KC21_ORYPU
MMLRGGRLAGLASRMVGAKTFSTEIFVSRLSFYTTEEELKNVFSPFGAVEEDVSFDYSLSEKSSENLYIVPGFQLELKIIRGRLIFVEIAKDCKTA